MACHAFLFLQKKTSKLTRSVERKSSCGHLSETARRFHHRSGPCGIPPWNPVCWVCCGSSWRPSWPLVYSPDSPHGQTQPLTPPLPCCVPRSGPSVLSTVAYFSPLLVSEWLRSVKTNKRAPACIDAGLVVCQFRSTFWVNSRLRRFITPRDHTWSFLLRRVVPVKRITRNYVTNAQDTDKALSNHLTS